MALYTSLYSRHVTQVVIRSSQRKAESLILALNGKMQGKTYILVTGEKNFGETFKNTQIEFLLPYRCEYWLWAGHHHRPSTGTRLPCYHGGQVPGSRPSSPRSASSFRACREFVTTSTRHYKHYLCCVRSRECCPTIRPGRRPHQ